MNNPSRSFELLRLWPGLATDPGTGREGEFYYNTTTKVIRVFDGTSWVDTGGIWANQHLSNLIGPTAINVDLLPDAPLIRNLGSSTLPWQRADIYNLSSVNSVNGSYGNGLVVDTMSTTGTDQSGGLNLTTGDTIGGNSGSILIRTGLPAGGTTVFLQQNTSFGSTAFNFSSPTFGVDLAGIQIVAASSASLSGVTFKLQNATGTADSFTTQVYVYNDNAGQPGTLVTSSPVVAVNLAGSATQDQLYTFNVPMGVQSGSTYYFILAAAGTVSTLNMLGSSSDIGSSNFTSSTNSGSTWTTTAAPDPYFILYTAPLRGTVDITSSAARLLTQTPLRFYDNDSSNYVALQSAASLSTNTTWTLPSADGSAGQFLQTNGLGVMSWQTVITSTDFADNVFRIHDDGDATKKLAFQISGVSTATTRTWTVPDSDINFAIGLGTFVARSGDTLTGSLVPNVAATLDFGSNALYWRDAYVNSITRQAQVIVGGGGTTLPSGTSSAYGLWDNAIGSLGTMAVWSQSNNAATATATGTVRLETGNKTAGTGNSGDIKLRIGTSSGGTRGSIYLQDGSEGTAGYIWTSTDTTGKGHWAPAAVTATPGGNNGAVQFNNSGSFGGDETKFFWNNTTKKLALGSGSPSGNLDVIIGGSGNGAYFWTGHTSGDTGIAFESGANIQGTNGSLSGAVDITLQPGGGNVLVPFSTSKVLIGSGTPASAPLTLRGTDPRKTWFEQTSASSANFFSFVNSAGTKEHYFGMENSTGTNLFGSGFAYALSIGTVQDQAIAFHTNNATTPRLLIQSTGMQASVDLSPFTTAARSLGSSTLVWLNEYLQNQYFYSGGTQYTAIESSSTNSLAMASGASVNMRISNNTSNQNLGISTTVSGIGTGTLYLESGNAVAGNSGGVYIQTGTATGTRGKIRLRDGTEGTAGYVWTSQDTVGTGSWQSASSVAAPTIEYRTLSSGEASANQLTLTGTPAVPSKTVADIFSGGGPMQYTAEFTVSGTTFSWAGGVYAGVLVAGDRIRIMYWT